jgi:NAD(P)-dependent dehydrogenase (short-subunit alcohol dehydrogenase family)
MSWSTQDIPDLGGKRAVVTGVTGGLGFHTALELGRAGAGLTVTARNPQKADDTLARLREELPDVDVEVLSLDLADLADVRRAVEELGSRHDRVDVLVNNAGIMIPPYSTTADGFELQIGTNHVGHFAWTAQVWPLLADDARVVSVSSLAHLQAKGIDLRSLTPEGSPRTYRRWVSYAESKLANLLFTRELARRLSAGASARTAVAAHPGLAATEITQTGMAMGHPVLGWLLTRAIRPGLQSAHAGAQPILRAALDPTLSSGDCVGPSWPGHTRGRPVLVRMPSRAHDEELAARLWSASEQAVGLAFPV